MKRITTFFLVIIAVLSGLVVLVGYFLPTPALVSVRVTMINWAMLLATVAILVGVANLLGVHFRKLRSNKELVYSFFLIVTLLGTFALVITFGPNNPYVVLLYSAVQVPIEASLMALLSVSLLYATIRLLRWRADLMGIIFIMTALVIFLGTAPLPFLGSVPVVSEMLRPVIAQVPAAAGARGILIGVALGTLMTGLRILLGADRPYGGK